MILDLKKNALTSIMLVEGAEEDEPTTKPGDA